MKKTPHQFKSTQEAFDHLIQIFPEDMRVATPLGLGKPNLLLNKIYAHFKDHKTKTLKIYTALSLEPPSFNEDLAKRLFKPIHERIWGPSYPSLQYYRDAKLDQIPENIQVHEFYFQAGSALRSWHLQRHYQAVNYTHAAENVLRAQVQVIVQLVAFEDGPGGRRYSFSCNPDMTLDVVELYQQKNQTLHVVGVLHPDLPFVEGDAEIAEDFFYALIQTQEDLGPLFALPRMPISFEDHLIGLFASSLVEDGGTLQIGIGSLSDAIVNALVIRHSHNLKYQDILRCLDMPARQLDAFNEGLYGLTEMLTDGFMHLHKAGILFREVIDDVSGERTYLHGSFFLGSKELYSWLKEMPASQKKGLRMTRVSKVNDLYDPNEVLLRKQRKKARFFNTTMQVSLLGEAMSETLNDGKVVSGVGGQYNFVAMSHELKGAKSVLMLRSTRYDSKGKRVSNIVWHAGHVTIPRHLRDTVVTEYGIANLRGQSDEECIKAILSITDSQFQQQLLDEAKAAQKISKDYFLPESQRNNSPEFLRKKILTEDRRQFLSPFALGSDFTPEERNLVLALQKLKQEKSVSPFKILKRLFLKKTRQNDYELELKRMGLLRPKGLRERIYRRLILSYLSDKNLKDG